MDLRGKHNTLCRREAVLIMPGVQTGIVREDPEASALLKRWLNNEEGEERKGTREGGREGGKEGDSTGFRTSSQFWSCNVHIDTRSSILHFDPRAKLNVPLHSVAPNPEIAH